MHIQYNASVKPDLRVLSAFPSNATDSAPWSASSLSSNTHIRKSLLAVLHPGVPNGTDALALLLPARCVTLSVAGNMLETSR